MVVRKPDKVRRDEHSSVPLVPIHSFIHSSNTVSKTDHSAHCHGADSNKRKSVRYGEFHMVIWEKSKTE